jgi:vancomycin resistance protein YoaR
MRPFVLIVALLLAIATPAAAEDPVSRVVLARFTTSYANDAEHKGRAFNIELAAEAINGKIIAAGGTFSFNDAVGERTAAFGYAKSVVIRDGMIAEGMGGGACQVASTLHAAALLAGLDVVMRAPHSRPSAYIRMGLDATVAMGAGAPAIDLKLKNPAADAVTIHARGTRGVLEVWVDTAGANRPEVSLTSEIVERTAFARVIERDKRAKDDTAQLKAFGIPGFRVKRTREIRSADGTVKRDVRIDVYPPTNEIVQVSPSFDESQSPKAVIDTGVPRPALVQLRPSTVVTLDNAAR